MEQATGSELINRELNKLTIVCATSLENLKLKST